MSNLKNLKNINFQFNKRFGQNFIFDTNLLTAIANDAEITKNTNVLEIGAGAGTLTKVLCEKAKKVISYEIDNNLQPVLNQLNQNYENLEIVFKDILKENTKIIEDKFNNQPYVLVANLPYYITTPIIFKFLEETQNLERMIIMVQKEVADRISATHSTKDYGVLTVLVNSTATAKITRIVKRENFHPQPNVDSAMLLINFEKNKYNINNYNIFKKVVKSAFAMRRKTLNNNLKNTFNLSSQQIQLLFDTLSLPPQIRGENLTVQDFVLLSNYINNILK